jgi:hypothetical protein
MDISEYMLLTDAVKVLGYSAKGTLKKFALEGRIPGAVKMGESPPGVWLIPRAWVEAEKNKPGKKRGEPKHDASQ